MDHRIAPARLAGRALTATMAVAGILAMALVAQPASAQQPKAADKKPAPAAAAPAAAAQQKPQLMYSPWTKICQKSAETKDKKVCAIGIQAQIETGQPILVVQIIDPEGGEKVLRTVMPIPLRVQPGTRLLIDQQELAKAPFVICGAQTGCIAEYKVDDAMVAKLKAGKMLDVQLVNVYNTVVTLPVPLTGFSKAFDGPALDQKAFEAQQRKLQEELQKKAEAARKKLESQTPAAPAKK